MSSPSLHDLAVKLATLEERMNTHKAQAETGFERLERYLEKRDKENTRWIVGAIVAATIVIIGALGILIRWPG